MSPENVSKLAALAEEAERLDHFDPFVLDADMPKSAYYVSVYLQV